MKKSICILLFNILTYNVNNTIRAQTHSASDFAIPINAGIKKISFDGVWQFTFAITEIKLRNAYS